MEFDFSTVNAMGRTYANGPRIVLKETRIGIERSVSVIEHDAKRLVPKDTRNLERTLTHEVVTHGQNVTGRAGTNEVYGPVVEFGRSAGAAMPPLNEAFLGWMRRHGIDAKYQFVVRRAIARRGTRKQPYLKPAFDKNRPDITREMRAVVIRIGNRLAAGRG